VTVLEDIPSLLGRMVSFNMAEGRKYVTSKVNRELLTYLILTYLFTHSMQQSPSCVANRSQLVKKFPAFYGTRMYITAFTSTRQSTPPHTTF